MNRISPFHCQMFERFPQKLREAFLDLYEDIDVTQTKFQLAPHGKGRTWRIRWRYRGRQRSLSVGSELKVIEAVRALLDDWRLSGRAFLHFMFPDEEIPKYYLCKILAGERQRLTDIHCRYEEMVREPAFKQPKHRPLNEMETNDFRSLPHELFMQLLALRKRVNVLVITFTILHRKDRGNWVMRWKESDCCDNIIQRSLNLGKDEYIADLVKRLTKAWRNWGNPLLDLLFPEKVVPPEYWGLDWLHRINAAFPDSPFVQEHLRPKLQQNIPMPKEMEDLVRRLTNYV